jgi:phosphoglycolate phosphatase-like HAD superfamily hydrolase
MLLLFDIDGTLLRGASREHAQALLKALHAVHGVTANTISQHGSAAGRTDGEIARLILLDAGVSAERIDERAADVQEQCCRLYATMCPTDLSERVVDGIPQTLEWLAGITDVQLSLVTGNFEPVARVKLRAAGIGHWFANRQGGFGSDSEDRSMLPPLARRRAGEAAGLGISWPREDTLVIGDTPRDIACAHADSVRCLAVTSGQYGEDELGAADLVARSSAELRAELGALLRL